MFGVALLLTATLTANNELCPCISDYPGGINVSDDCVWVTVNNQPYCYNMSFGLRKCHKWDKDAAPFCENNENTFCNLP